MKITLLNPRSSGLVIWADAISWQGFYANDAKLFLRRDKTQPEKFTNHQFGNLPEALMAKLLAEFITITGGIFSAKISFANVTTAIDNREHINLEHDTLIRLATIALKILNISIDDTRLVPDGPCWKTELYLKL